MAFLHILGIELFGELHGEIHALFDEARALPIGIAGFAHLIEFREQAVEVLGIKTLAEVGVLSRPREIVVAHQLTHQTSRQLRESAGRTFVLGYSVDLNLTRRAKPVFLPLRQVKRKKMGAAFVFPGQGSQSVGMGKALAAQFASARAVFDEVDAALGEKLSATI